MNDCRKVCLVISIWALCYPQSQVECYAQTFVQDVPLNARGIDVEDRVGEFVPLELLFNDERGNRIGLAKFFKQGRPIVLTLNYSDCPGLCIAHLENLVSTLRESDGAGLGSRFEIVTVSIDPTESPVKAALTKQKYIGMLGASAGEGGWHFLTGDQQSISRLADAVGFKYTYDKPNKRYSHPAVTYFISSDGRICRYFLSLGTEPAQFRLAIADATEGRLSASVSDVVMQMCYLYDPNTNRYSVAAYRIMAVGWGAFALMLFGCIAPFWFGKRGGVKPHEGMRVASSAGNVGLAEQLPTNNTAATTTVHSVGRS